MADVERLESVRARRRFDVDEVRRMVEAGILSEDEHLELIEGELLVVRPQGPKHSVITEILRDRLRDAYAGAGYCVRSEKPLTVTERSEPEPDLAVVRGETRDYIDRHPAGSDALLVIEVAVTALTEATDKLEVYAGAGVPFAWILDVSGRRLSVHAGPEKDGGYASVTMLGDADDVALPGLPAARWKVADLLP